MTHPRIVFTRDAGRDLDLLYDWICADSGENRAEAVLRRIHQTLETVATMPGMGRPRRDLRGAPRGFAVYPWLILYESLGEGDGVVVLRVIDGRRDIPRHVR